MSSYATSAEVHRTLSAAFGPWCRSTGFKRIGSGKCAYLKVSSENSSLFLAFEVQCNSFGNGTIGNRFTLNAGAGTDARHLTGAQARILSHPARELLSAAEATEQRIRSRHPEIEWPNCSWEPGRDNWCSYYDVEDVRIWGELLIQHLPSLFIRLLLQSALSPEQFGLSDAQA